MPVNEDLWVGVAASRCDNASADSLEAHLAVTAAALALAGRRTSVCSDLQHSATSCCWMVSSFSA
eukprot:1157751-Pelagomonas_calceolata.AAC.1